MEELKAIFITALKLAKSQEGATRNTKLTKDLSQIIRRNYKDSETARTVTSILKQRKPSDAKSAASSIDSGWDDWVPGKTNAGKKERKPLMDVVEDNIDDVPFESFGTMTPQEIIDHFGTVPKLRDFVKELGLEIDSELPAMDYINEFQIHVLSMIEEEEEEEDFEEVKISDEEE